MTKHTNNQYRIDSNQNFYLYLIFPILSLLLLYQFSLVFHILHLILHLTFNLQLNLHLILYFLIFHLIHTFSLESYRAAVGTFNLRLGNRFSQTKIPVSQKTPENEIVSMLLMSVLFICFEYLNLHYGLVKFFKLTTENDESNEIL